jgi:hypothetical protein
MKSLILFCLIGLAAAYGAAAVGYSIGTAVKATHEARISAIETEVMR